MEEIDDRIDVIDNEDQDGKKVLILFGIIILETNE